MGEGDGKADYPAFGVVCIGDGLVGRAAGSRCDAVAGTRRLDAGRTRIPGYILGSIISLPLCAAAALPSSARGNSIRLVLGSGLHSGDQPDPSPGLLGGVSRKAPVACRA